MAGNNHDFQDRSSTTFNVHRSETYKNLYMLLQLEYEYACWIYWSLVKFNTLPQDIFWRITCVDLVKYIKIISILPIIHPLIYSQSWLWICLFHPVIVIHISRKHYTYYCTTESNHIWKCSLCIFINQKRLVHNRPKESSET